MTRQFTPPEAVDRYMTERGPDLSDSSRYNIKSALKQFVAFCAEEGVEEIDDIDAFLLSDYRLKRSEEVSENTVYNNLTALRKFISWCEGRNLIDDSLSENMIIPTDRDTSRDTTLAPERVEDILAYLQTYEYASQRHALFALLWDTGIRIGAARSLNVGSVNENGGYIELEHKPDEDRPLKNGTKSERQVNLSPTVMEVVTDYIEARRIDQTDDFGNEPLFSSKHGRKHRTTLRKAIVKMTRPCALDQGCPHDREIDECEATGHSYAARCPSSVSPHPIRRSSITYWLNEGHPKELLSDRMDVSTTVLEEHYDSRSEEQKRELRREMLEIE
ncbi:MAG: site-specific recombinase XerD [Natronomonas sp.]|jgi:site-specific recombinase XerD